jgi:hypothetical protein
MDKLKIPMKVSETYKAVTTFLTQRFVVGTDASNGLNVLHRRTETGDRGTSGNFLIQDPKNTYEITTHYKISEIGRDNKQMEIVSVMVSSAKANKGEVENLLLEYVLPAIHTVAKAEELTVSFPESAKITSLGRLNIPLGCVVLRS